MGSSAQDQKTQKAASTGAQTNDATLDANAAQNQTYANNARRSLFGTYNPTSGSYSGGTESQFLNPATLTQNGLTGSYLNTYNNESNQAAKTAQDGVSSAMQNLANGGMGKSPIGFKADQERKAYEDQAATQGNLYSQQAGAQQSQAEANYANANSMLDSNASNTALLSLQGNQAAAGNYSNLYGTASTQKQSGLAATATALGQLGQGAGAVMGGL